MAAIYLLYFTIMAGVHTGITMADYCNLDTCKTKGPHTMCKYTSTTPAVTCGKWTRIGLNYTEQQAIVNKHNELRQNVASGKENGGNPGPQSPATRMPNLTWDDEQATIAQRWANQCQSGHDKCRDVKRFVVGQNIAKSSSSGENASTWESAVQLWYDEVAYFDHKKVQKFEFDLNIGHYSQVVWAKTEKIGCGASQFKNSAGWYEKYLVCNYGPSGNYQGEEVYPTKK